MSEEPKPPRKRGRHARLSPTHPSFPSGEMKIEVGQERRSTIVSRAKAANLTCSQYIAAIIDKDGAEVVIPDGLMDRIRRNCPGGCTAEQYALHLITEGLNQRGEY